MGQGEQIGAQAVVKTHQLSNAFGRKTLQEAAQGALVGKSQTGVRQTFLTF